jgi:hypothetical protein
MTLKGKPLSLGAKITGAVIALGGLAAKIWIKPELDIDAVLKVALFVPLLFVTVDLSLIAEVVFGRKMHGFGSPVDDGPGTGPKLGEGV